TVQNNFIGTNKNGNDILPNAGFGILLEGASFTTIGGPVDMDSNLISGNFETGIDITFSSLNTKVQGNFIGTDKGGSVALANEGNGVATAGGSNNTTIVDNLISGNNDDAIYLSSNGNTVQGNAIGVNKDSLVALPNQGNGITIANGGANLIGGETIQVRNLIS